MNKKATHDWWLDMSEVESFAWYDNIFTDEELDMIEKSVSDTDLHDGEIMGDQLDTDIRDSKIKFI